MNGISNRLFSLLVTVAMDSHNHQIICPCCETVLQVDIKTGEVIWQEKKTKEFGSLSDMVKGLDSKSY